MSAIEQEEGGIIRYRRTIVRTAIGSVGSGEYRELYISRGRQTVDTIGNGEYACALSTSAIFHRFGLLESAHTTVDGLEAELLTSSLWRIIPEARPGAIGILEAKRHRDGSLKNRHCFICIGYGSAVHNDARPEFRSPQIIRIQDFKHHTGARRRVETYFLHNYLT